MSQSTKKKGPLPPPAQAYLLSPPPAQGSQRGGPLRPEIPDEFGCEVVTDVVRRGQEVRRTLVPEAAGQGLSLEQRQRNLGEAMGRIREAIPAPEASSPGTPEPRRGSLEGRQAEPPTQAQP